MENVESNYSYNIIRVHNVSRFVLRLEIYLDEGKVDRGERLRG